VCVFTCICIYIYMYIYIWIDAFAHTHIYIYIYLFIYIYVNPHLKLSLSLCANCANDDSAIFFLGVPHVETNHMLFKISWHQLGIVNFLGRYIFGRVSGSTVGGDQLDSLKCLYQLADSTHCGGYLDGIQCWKLRKCTISHVSVYSMQWLCWQQATCY
jgi:hypothetical protein